MTTFTIELPAHLAEYVKRRIAATPGESVNDYIESLVERDCGETEPTDCALDVPQMYDETGRRVLPECFIEPLDQRFERKLRERGNPELTPEQRRELRRECWQEGRDEMERLVLEALNDPRPGRTMTVEELPAYLDEIRQEAHHRMAAEKIR